jgi:hypothetical protein
MTEETLPSQADIARICAIGMTDQEIARYEKLGRDHDGVAGVLLYLCAKALRIAHDKLALRLKDFKPDPENINALPEPLRAYVHDLETRADPAGDIQRIASLTEQRDALVAGRRELEAEIKELRKRLEGRPDAL